jgi:hypothetical protein
MNSQTYRCCLWLLIYCSVRSSILNFGRIPRLVYRMMRTSEFNGYSGDRLSVMICNHRCESSSQTKHKKILEDGQCSDACIRWNSNCLRKLTGTQHGRASARNSLLISSITTSTFQICITISDINRYVLSFFKNAVISILMSATASIALNKYNLSKSIPNCEIVLPSRCWSLLTRYLSDSRRWVNRREIRFWLKLRNWAIIIWSDLIVFN